MPARRARQRRTIAGSAVVGALALVVLLTGAGLASVASNLDTSTAHHAVVGPRDTKATLGNPAGGRGRGNPWIASLATVLACALLGVHAVRSVRLRNYRRVPRELSFRLRGPPALVVAH